MFLRLEPDVIIEDRRGHAPAVLESLRALLAQGVHASLDPRRGDCYDLEDGARAYYIYVSPVTGRVVLLASCRKVAASAALDRPQAIGTPLFRDLALV